jgi:uncharacterized DUF497 family protein
VEFEWDRREQTANLKKHGVEFADAFAVFTDPLAVTVHDRSADEERFITIGSDISGRLLSVVYTWRGDVIRLISARRATRNERRQYEGDA